MAVKQVRVFPDPELRKVAEEVALPDESIQALVKDMLAVMREEGGIGLAAPQVGVSKRVVVVSVEAKGFERLALINPVITVLVGGMIGLMMISVFLPIFELGGAIRGR